MRAKVKAKVGEKRRFREIRGNSLPVVVLLSYYPRHPTDIPSTGRNGPKCMRNLHLAV
jgi:hypothetical protein